MEVKQISSFGNPLVSLLLGIFFGATVALLATISAVGDITDEVLDMTASAATEDAGVQVLDDDYAIEVPMPLDYESVRGRVERVECGLGLR